MAVSVFIIRQLFLFIIVIVIVFDLNRPLTTTESAHLDRNCEIFWLHWNVYSNKCHVFSCGHGTLKTRVWKQQKIIHNSKKNKSHSLPYLLYKTNDIFTVVCVCVWVCVYFCAHGEVEWQAQWHELSTWSNISNHVFSTLGPNCIEFVLVLSAVYLKLFNLKW